MKIFQFQFSLLILLGVTLFTPARNYSQSPGADFYLVWKTPGRSLLFLLVILWGIVGMPYLYESFFEISEFMKTITTLFSLFLLHGILGNA